MLRASSVLFRPTTSLYLQQQQIRGASSAMNVSKREFLDHFSHLNIGTIFSSKEMNHILGLLPTMLQKAVMNNSREITVTDKKFSGIDGNRTVYERITPKSFESQLDLLISRDSILRDAVEKKPSKDGDCARYSVNLK